MKIVKTTEEDEEVLKVFLDGDELVLESERCDIRMSISDALDLVKTIQELANETVPKTTKAKRKKAQDENC